MVKQVACILTDFVGDGTTNDPYILRFADSLQGGEYSAWNYVDLYAVVSQYDENLPDPDAVDKHAVVRGGQDLTNGLAIVYVYAEDTRIALADTSPHYHVWWTYNATGTRSTKDPRDNPSSIEQTALLSYLVTQTGRTQSQILGYLRAYFGVDNNTQLSNAFQSNERYKSSNRLAELFEGQGQNE